MSDLGAQLRTIRGLTARLEALEARVKLLEAAELDREIAGATPPAVHVSARRPMRDFVAAAARAAGVGPAEVVGSGRRRGIAHPRMVGMHLARVCTGASYARIARAFGGRESSTAKHADHTVADPERRAEFSALLVQMSAELGVAPPADVAEARRLERDADEQGDAA